MALVLAVACTGSGTDEVTPAPSPLVSTGQAEPARVGVVLPPDGAITEEAERLLRDGVERIAAAVATGVELRVVQPDGPAFVADAATVLAADGYRLVCVLSADAVDEVVQAAANLPGTQFCVDADRATNPPANVWAPRPRYQEASWLVGVTAALLGAEVVGMIVREGEPALSAKRQALIAGWTSVLRDAAANGFSPVVGTITDQDADVGPVVEAVVSQQPEVVVVDAGALDQGIVSALEEQAPGVRLIRWVDAPDSGVGPPGSIIVARDSLAVFRMALEAWIAGSLSELPQTVGISEGIHAIGPARAGDRIPALEQLDVHIEALRNGQVDLGAPGAP